MKKRNIKQGHAGFVVAVAGVMVLFGRLYKSSLHKKKQFEQQNSSNVFFKKTVRSIGQMLT